MLIPAHIIEELLKRERETSENSLIEITIQSPEVDSREYEPPKPPVPRGVEDIDYTF